MRIAALESPVETRRLTGRPRRTRWCASGRVGRRPGFRHPRASGGALPSYGAVPGPPVPSATPARWIAAHDPQAKVLAESGTGGHRRLRARFRLTATRHGDVLVIRGEVRAVPPRRKPPFWCYRYYRLLRVVVLRNDQLEIEGRYSDPLRLIAHKIGPTRSTS